MIPILLPVLLVASPALTIEPVDGDSLRVKVVGDAPQNVRALPEGRIKAAVGERVMTLHLVDKRDKLGPPLLARYTRRGDSLELRPRYSLTHGQTYRAILRLPPGEFVSKDYRVPARPPTEPGRVTAVYPSADVLPENHLKFYIHFSKPMREGREIFDQIHLVDEDGEPLPHPWRRTELWDADARRLTLWIHPGRVKTGVNLRTELGPVLKAGQRYRLVISNQLRDAEGQRLARSFTKAFRAEQADRIRPLPERWRFSFPTVKTREPLRLELKESLDHALLHRFVEVRDASGERVAGRIAVANNESTWSFTPTQQWGRGIYSIEVDENLEDLAGNTPLRVFDTDRQERRPTPPRLSLPFELE